MRVLLLGGRRCEQPGAGRCEQPGQCATTARCSNWLCATHLELSPCLIRAIAFPLGEGAVLLQCGVSQLVAGGGGPDLRSGRRQSSRGGEGRGPPSQGAICNLRQHACAKALNPLSGARSAAGPPCEQAHLGAAGCRQHEEHQQAPHGAGDKSRRAQGAIGKEPGFAWGVKLASALC